MKKNKYRGTLFLFALLLLFAACDPLGEKIDDKLLGELDFVGGGLPTIQGNLDLDLGIPQYVDISAGAGWRIWFLAPSSGDYIFESSNSGSLNPCAFTSDQFSSHEFVINDNGAGGLNYRFTRTMSEGEWFSFYSGVSNHRNVSGSYTVTVTMW